MYIYIYIFIKVVAAQLCGDNRAEEFYFFTGRGGNGKSLFADMMKAALNEGDTGYFKSFNPELLTGRAAGAEGVSPVMESLRGRRCVITGEPEHNEKVNIGLVKRLTGGDTITARKLHGAPVSFKPQFTPNIMCNDMPDLAHVDGGITRRTRVIEFEFLFKTQEEIDALKRPDPRWKLIDSVIKGQIASEPGFGQALLFHLLDVYEANKHIHKHPPPPKVRAVTDAYLLSSNKVAQWLSEFYIVTSDTADRVTAATLFKEYKADTGDRAMLNEAFGREMVKLVERKRMTAGNFYLRLARRDVAHEDEEDSND